MIRFVCEARVAFEEADDAARADAAPALALLSACLEVTWFRAVGPRVWAAVVTPAGRLDKLFGLRQPGFVVGHGLARDFHERALLQSPPPDLDAHLDPRVRFVASDMPLASAACAAWSARHHTSGAVVAPGASADAGAAEHYLHRALGTSLRRRDLFADHEPVRRSAEFIGRESVVHDLLAHVVGGHSVGLFGLRRIGKTSLLGRAEGCPWRYSSSVGGAA